MTEIIGRRSDIRSCPTGRFPVVMTIAGSDSGGGAGIQADLRTFAELNVFGTSAITCITAQNPDGISGIQPVSPRMISLQIKSICEGFSVAAAKIGMLYSAPIIRAVANMIDEYRIAPLVIDPVMVATSGRRLLQNNAVGVLCEKLLPKATVITPNVNEAQLLWGHPILSLDDMHAAARALGERFGNACVIKGGHLGARRGQRSEVRSQKAEVVDVLYWKNKTYELRGTRIRVTRTHGTGCVFSAALTAFLARGESLVSATEMAQEHVRGVLTTTTLLLRRFETRVRAG
jgi:hydroxymethylpyrimidine/phosphomethylpyrimidine kinase